VIPPIVARPDGTYIINLREYDPSSYSDSTDTTDTPPALGTAWASASPPIISWFSSVYSGTEYDAFYVDGSGRQVYGDTDTATTVTGSQVRLPNNIPLYALKTGGSTIGAIKCDTSDRIVIGDGSEPIYAACTTFVIQDDALIQSGTAADWGTRVNLINHTSGTITVGDSGGSLTQTTIEGDVIALNTAGEIVYFKGLLSGTPSAPSTTELPNNNEFCIWEETDTNIFTWQINDGGTIRQIS